MPLVKEDWVRECLGKLDIHKSFGPDRMLTVIFEWLWWPEEVPKEWKKANVTPFFKQGKKEDPWSYQLQSASPQSLER